LPRLALNLDPLDLKLPSSLGLQAGTVWLASFHILTGLSLF
jgi:hypothetical protein